MKRALINIMHRAGAFAPFRMANRGKALILTYHRFSRGSSVGAVSARDFAEHVRYLSRHYRVVPLSALARQLRSGESLAPATAVITIDDGYRDAYEIAFPILRRYHVPATLFVVTDFLDRKVWLWTDKLRYLIARTQLSTLEVAMSNTTLKVKLNRVDSHIEAAERLNSQLKTMPDESKEETIREIASVLGVRLPELPPYRYCPITWHQAREMDGSGLEIGSHTKTHPILTNVDDERLRGELFDSRTRLETMLDREVDLFCYPNGDYDKRVRGEVRMAGYGCGVTVDWGFNEQGIDPLCLRRMDGEADFTRFIQVTSGFDQIKNRLRRVRSNRATIATS